jgi:hypothetical protein
VVVKGYKTWSHHGEAESTFNNADIDTRYDEVGDEDADENDHVIMDDAFGCKDQNDDQTDAPQVDEECDVDMGGYAAKMAKWRKEEEERRVAGLPTLLKAWMSVAGIGSLLEFRHNT